MGKTSDATLGLNRLSLEITLTTQDVPRQALKRTLEKSRGGGG
jgi:hypothetical protein